MGKMRLPTIHSSTLVERTEKHELRVDGDFLLHLLQAAGYLIPDHATVSFGVPGGGDWSNTDIDIDERHPVLVEWTNKTMEGSLGLRQRPTG